MWQLADGLWKDTDFPVFNIVTTRALGDMKDEAVRTRLLARLGVNALVTALVKKMIEENNLAEVVNLMRTGQYYGMQTFNQALIKLFQAGEIKLEEALAAATNPEELMLSIRGIQSGAEDANSIFER